jgi:hypothetical protein
MTYGRFKNLTSALLIQDVTLTEEEEELLGLLEYAYSRVAMEANSIHLTVPTPYGYKIARQITEEQYIRFPELPENDDSIMDIDETLIPAVSRYICSFISVNKAQFHELKAFEIIRDYNQELESYIEKLEQYGYLTELNTENQSGSVMLSVP